LLQARGTRFISIKGLRYTLPSGGAYFVKLRGGREDDYFAVELQQYVLLYPKPKHIEYKGDKKMLSASQRKEVFPSSNFIGFKALHTDVLGLIGALRFSIVVVVDSSWVLRIRSVLTLLGLF